MIGTDDRPTPVPRSPAHRPVLAGTDATRLRLFGGATLFAGAQLVTGRGVQRHRIALLALLATTRRLYRSRDQLIAWLWPDADPERGRRLLSDSVYRINHALGGDAIAGTATDLRLNRARVASDVAEFEAAIDARDWSRAVDLYGGPFLDGFYLPNTTDFDQWMEGTRGQYARAAARAIESLAAEARQAGHADDEVDWWQRLARMVPDDSRVAMELMRALERAGNRAGALRHAQEHARVLRQTLDVAPDRTLRELVEQIAGRDVAPAMTGASSAAGHPTSAVTGPPETAKADAPGPAAGTSGSADRAIAVLPFRNVGDPDDTAHVADGVSEELMYLLTRTPGLRVASRTSAFAYQEMKLDVGELARRLHVAWVLEGTVRRSDDLLRVTVLLTDARSGYQAWSGCFDRTASEILAIQEEIAAAITQRLVPLLGAGAPPEPAVVPGASDTGAYDLYLRARYHWHRPSASNLEASARLFDQVVARDPDHARAWSGLADTRVLQALNEFVQPREAFAHAWKAAKRALQLAPTLASPHAVLACVDACCHRRWDAADEGFRRGIALEPLNGFVYLGYGNLLAARGRFDEAVRILRRSAELDPLALVAHASMGWVLLLAGQPERAIQELERALALEPDFHPAYYWIGVAHLRKGDPPSALSWLGRMPGGGATGPGMTATQALAHAASGDVDAARTSLDALLERERAGAYVSSSELARVHLALGEVAVALDRLERAFEECSPSMVFLRVDPQFRPLLGEPRMRALLERMG